MLHKYLDIEIVTFGAFFRYAYMRTVILATLVSHRQQMGCRNVKQNLMLLFCLVPDILVNAIHILAYD